MKLSVVIPARNEAECITGTLEALVMRLEAARIPHEVIVVDDGSTDGTPQRVQALARRHTQVRLVTAGPGPGYGMAVRAGLAHSTGDPVAIMMADGSDSPEDLVLYYRMILEGHECAFGSRFIKGSRLVGYPIHKLVLNRLVNWFIKLLFRIPYNDVTNAFKCYRREVIEGMQPLISRHFNLTVEMPLKAIVRGYTYAVAPISWTARKKGISKLKLPEMGSRYMFIILYLWLEKHLARRGYHRRTRSAVQSETDARHV